MTTVLAFDTAAAHCAAAVLCDGRVTTRIDPMSRGQAEHLVPLLEDLLRHAGLSWTDLDAIGVGIGPGNFTGTRIAVSLARGLALGLGVPAIGVTTLEAQVEGIAGPCLSLVDARRDRLYAQFFDTGAAGAPELCDLDQLPRSPDGVTPRVTGDGAATVAARLGTTVVAAPVPPVHAMALIAARRAATPQPRPAPLYLRAADAAPPRDPAPILLS